MVTYPKDIPYRRSLQRDLSQGDSSNVSTFETSAHVGTHVDAPRHYIPRGYGADKFPTICGTGEEDYFCGSYGYEERPGPEGKNIYTDFSTPYTGFYRVKDQNRFGQYRWHVTDPVRFEKDLKVTIQSLGWQSEGRYLPLQDDLASVAYWYQTEPHLPFPKLPDKESLELK